MSEFKGFYFDEHNSRAVANGLIARGISVMMAVDVDMVEKDDDTEHLPYASERGLVMVTFDRPFAGRTQSRTDQAGVVCLSETIRRDIGKIIEFWPSSLPFTTGKKTQVRFFGYHETAIFL